MKFNSKKGFTLIELLVVISIIGLLSSVVLASLNTARSKAILAAGLEIDTHTYHAFGASAALVMDFNDKVSGSSVVNGDTIIDSSGNNNNGTVMCTGCANDHWVTGVKSNSALQFGSAGDYVAITGMKGYLGTTNNYSVSLWVNPTTIAGTQMIVAWGAGNYNQAVFIELSSGKFKVDQWGGPAATLPNSDIKAGVWSHVVYSFSLGQVNLYINGKLTDTLSTDLDNLVPKPDSNVVIGYCPNCGTGSLPYSGSIDNLRIYSQSLQVGQIEKIYAYEREQMRLAGRD